MSTKQALVSYDRQQLRDAARYIFERNPAVKTTGGCDTIEEVYQEMKRRLIQTATENAQRIAGGKEEWCTSASSAGWTFNFFIADNERDIEVDILVDPSLGMERTYMLTDEPLELEERVEDLSGKTVIHAATGEEFVVIEDKGETILVCWVFDPMMVYELPRDEVEDVDDWSETDNDEWIGKKVIYKNRSYNVIGVYEEDPNVLVVIDSITPGTATYIAKSLVEVMD